MQAAKIPLLETEQCIAPQVYGPNKIGSGMFCAGFLAGGVDTCQANKLLPQVTNLLEALELLVVSNFTI